MPARVPLVVLALLAGWQGTGFLGAATQPSAGVTLRGVRFDPMVVHVDPGGTVTWTHDDPNIEHSVTADDGSFDSHPSCGQLLGSCMKEGQQFAQTFSQPGTVAYHCRVHSGMRGTVEVRSTATSPPPTTGPATTPPPVTST
ncbi:MAG: plastocyanin/azurin family copper-binding protein, partial [Acidimicrobiales bacterium]